MTKIQKIDKVAKLYLTKYAEEPYLIGSKLNPAYFRIRCHFNKQDEETINRLYKFLMESHPASGKTITNLYNDVDNNRIGEIENHNRVLRKNIKSSGKQYSIDDIMDF